MNNQSLAEFDRLLSLLFRTMGKPVPDADVKRVWWEATQHLELDEFSQACSSYIRSEERYPVPAAVLRHVQRRRKMLCEDDESSPEIDEEGKRRIEALLAQCRRNVGRQA